MYIVKWSHDHIGHFVHREILQCDSKNDQSIIMSHILNHIIFEFFLEKYAKKFKKKF